MRRSMIWFALAVAWGLDGLLALVRHNWQPMGLTALFALCFFAAGLMFRRRERRQTRPRSM